MCPVDGRTGDIAVTRSGLTDAEDNKSRLFEEFGNAKRSVVHRFLAADFSANKGADDLGGQSSGGLGHADRGARCPSGALHSSRVLRRAGRQSQNLSDLPPRQRASGVLGVASETEAAAAS